MSVVQRKMRVLGEDSNCSQLPGYNIRSICDKCCAYYEDQKSGGVLGVDGRLKLSSVRAV